VVSTVAVPGTLRILPETGDVPGVVLQTQRTSVPVLSETIARRNPRYRYRVQRTREISTAVSFAWWSPSKC